MTIQSIVASVLILGGLFFLVVSCVGLLRLPDYYARNHAVGKSETLGVMLVLTGLAVYNGLTLTTWKLVLIVLFVMIANPTATHVILRGALRCGLQPWTLRSKGKQPDPTCENGIPGAGKGADERP